MTRAPQIRALFPGVEDLRDPGVVFEICDGICFPAERRRVGALTPPRAVAELMRRLLEDAVLGFRLLEPLAAAAAEKETGERARSELAAGLAEAQEARQAAEARRARAEEEVAALKKEVEEVQVQSEAYRADWASEVSKVVILEAELKDRAVALDLARQEGQAALEKKDQEIILLTAEKDRLSGELAQLGLVHEGQLAEARREAVELFRYSEEYRRLNVAFSRRAYITGYDRGAGCGFRRGFERALGRAREVVDSGGELALVEMRDEDCASSLEASSSSGATDADALEEDATTAPVTGPSTADRCC